MRLASVLILVLSLVAPDFAAELERPAQPFRAGAPSAFAPRVPDLGARLGPPAGLPALVSPRENFRAQGPARAAVPATAAAAAPAKAAPAAKPGAFEALARLSSSSLGRGPVPVAPALGAFFDADSRRADDDGSPVASGESDNASGRQHTKSGHSMLPGAPDPPPPAKPHWLKSPAGQVALWASAAGLFDLGLWWRLGAGAASQFTAAYVLEWSLSFDNLIVIAALLKTVPATLRPAVLRWGLIGTVLARLGMIALGAKLTALSPLGVYAMSGLLLTVAFKMLNPKWDLFAALAKPFQGRPASAKKANPLVHPLLWGTLGVIGYGIVFALDSVPAALAVSRSVFLVFGANAFAVMGMGSLFLVVERLEKRFAHLPKAVAAALFFVAGKMIAEAALGWALGPLATMTIVLALLGLGAAASPIRR